MPTPPRGQVPLHPGEYLRLSVMPGLAAQGIDFGTFAQRLGVDHQVLKKLIDGVSGMTPSMALRLSRVLGDLPEFWMAMQASFDLARAEPVMREQLAGLKPVGKGKGR